MGNARWHPHFPRLPRRLATSHTALTGAIERTEHLLCIPAFHGRRSFNSSKGESRMPVFNTTRCTHFLESGCAFHVSDFQEPQSAGEFDCKHSLFNSTTVKVRRKENEQRSTPPARPRRRERGALCRPWAAPCTGHPLPAPPLSWTSVRPGPPCAAAEAP